MKTSKTRVLLCVVMTILMLAVAMSVSADSAAVGKVTTVAGDGDDVVVTVPVTGVTGKATIMVYPTGVSLAAAKENPMANIKYIDEATATDGEAAFRFAVDAGQYNMTVGGGGATSLTTTLDATVNNTPVFANPTATVAKDSGIYEEALTIGTYVATDADIVNGDSLTYTIDAAATEASFAIEETTGVLTFTGTLTAGDYTVTVTATDTKGATATCVVTINVAASNTRPSFGEYDTEVEVEAGDYTETALVIGTYKATDVDGDTLKYTANSDTQGFTVDADGKLTFSGELAAGKYYVKIVVNDDKDEDSISLTITAENPNTYPAFAEEAYTAEFEEGIYEEALTIGTYEATDAEGTVAYSDDAEDFVISAEGVLTYTGTLDDGTYTVNLTATDAGGLTDTATVTITVTNVAPVFDTGLVSTKDLEAGEYKDEVIGTYTATDDVDDITYSVEGEGFSIDPAEGILKYTGTLTKDAQKTAVITATDDTVGVTYSVTIVGIVTNTEPVFANDTETATIAIGKYTTAQELITVVADDAENDILTYSVDADAEAVGFAVDANGKVTFTGEITENIDVVVTAKDNGLLSDSYTLSVTAENKAFAAREILPIETIVKIPAEATNFSAAVGIPETVTVKYLYGEVEKEKEIAVDWALDKAAVEEGLEDGGTVAGTLNAEALAAANIDLGEIANEVSFTYKMVEITFSVTVNGLETSVINALPGSVLEIATEYVGLGTATYAYKLVELSDRDAANTVPADDEFAATLAAINAPAAGEGMRLIIYAKDGNKVTNVVKFVYGANPYAVSVELDGQARYWNVKNGESVTASVIVTDINTADVVDAENYEVTYKLVKKDGTVIDGVVDGDIITPAENGAYSVVATVTVNGVNFVAQRTLYVMDTAFTATINVNGTTSPLKVAANSELTIDPVVDFIPTEGIEWQTGIIDYNGDANAIETEWAMLATREVATVPAGTAGTKKVVANFKRGGADATELTRTRTVYVRGAKNLYAITGNTRNGAAYTSDAIGEEAVALGIAGVDGPGELADLTMKIEILEYRSEGLIDTYDAVAATETIEVAKADWFEKIVDPAEGAPASRNVVRVRFVLIDADGDEVGSIKRVLFL